MFTAKEFKHSSRSLAFHTGKMLGCPYKDGMSTEEASVGLFNCLLKMDVQNVTFDLFVSCIVLVDTFTKLRILYYKHRSKDIE